MHLALRQSTFVAGREVGGVAGPVAAGGVDALGCVGVAAGAGGADGWTDASRAARPVGVSSASVCGMVSETRPSEQAATWHWSKPTSRSPETVKATRGAARSGSVPASARSMPGFFFKQKTAYELQV